MNDKERVSDLLMTEKKMSGNYDTYASECTNIQLRDVFLGMLTAGHHTQTDLFQAGSQRGWYQAPAADGAKINQTYQKFSSMSC